MKHAYSIEATQSGIIVSGLTTRGSLVINFSEHVILEDLEDSPIVELANFITEKINDLETTLIIRGENHIFLTHRYGFDINGYVLLDNTKLINPRLFNVSLTNVNFGDINKLTQCNISYSELNSVSVWSDEKPIDELKAKFISASNIVFKLPGDFRDNTLVLEYKKFEEM